MAKKQELVKVEKYQIMTIDPDRAREVIKSNVGPQGFDQFDMDRIRIPSGGQTSWQIVDLEGEETAEKEISGIIVHFSDPRRLYKEAFEKTGGGTPPDCASDDGISGVGDPGGLCAKCPFAQFGSAVDKDGKASRGQACQQRRMLFLVRQGEIIPTIVSLPPTSLKAARTFFLRLGGRMLPYWAVSVALSLEKDKNREGIEYSKVKIVLQETLADGHLKHLEAIRSTLLPLLQRTKASDDDFDRGDPVEAE